MSDSRTTKSQRSGRWSGYSDSDSPPHSLVCSPGSYMTGGQHTDKSSTSHRPFKSDQRESTKVTRDGRVSTVPKTASRNKPASKPQKPAIPNDDPRPEIYPLRSLPTTALSLPSRGARSPKQKGTLKTVRALESMLDHQTTANNIKSPTWTEYTGKPDEEVYKLKYNVW